jgi:AbrB family looped-hinge helix DNA binding protein
MKREVHATLRVAAGGRIVIPAEVRRQLGLEVGTEVVLSVEEDCAILTSARAARRNALKRVRRYIPPGESLSQELMAERKKEAERE